MNIESIVAEELRAVAENLQIPVPPDTATLGQLAEHDIWRRRARVIILTGLAAAVVVAVAVLRFQADRPDSASPITPSPSYYASGVPYVEGGKLYIDHKAQPGNWDWVSTETAGHYTFAERWESTHGTIVILRDGKPVETVQNIGPGVAVSPDGTKVAWITLADHNAGTLSLLRLSTLTVIGQVRIIFPQGTHSGCGPGSCFDAGLSPQDNGTVNYALGDQGWTWRPGRKPVRSQAGFGGTVYHNPAGFPGVSETVRLSPDHLWGTWLTRTTNTVNFQKPGTRAVGSQSRSQARPGNLVRWDGTPLPSPWPDFHRLLTALQ